MSVWEQDNGNHPFAHFKIKFCCWWRAGHMCCSHRGRNNSPQGVTDVIQILDFQHFKVSASGSLNNWRLRPSKRNVSVEERASLPRIYQSRCEKRGRGCVPAARAANIDSLIFVRFYSLTYTVPTSSRTNSLWTYFCKKKRCFPHHSFITNVEVLDVDRSQRGAKETQKSLNQTRRRSDTDK